MMRTRKEYNRRTAYKRKRSAQMQDGFQEPVSYKKLYERDNGICQICGLPVLSHNEKDKWGGTRDHVIPLSRGGKHSYDNCQLAHRICNSLKLDSENYHIDWEILIKERPKLSECYRDYQKRLAEATPGVVKYPGDLGQ